MRINEEIDDIELIEILLRVKMKHENVLNIVRSVTKLENVAEGLKYMKVGAESLTGLENTRNVVRAEIEAKKRYLLSETAMSFEELKQVYRELGEL